MNRLAVAYLRPPEELWLDPTNVPPGLRVLAVVADGDGEQRGELATALEWIVSGEADTLYVQRLSAAAGSLGELTRLLEWLEQAGASLLAADVALDTRQRAGLRSVALLREVERWQREPDPGRRPRGRPGLTAGSPALADRIAELRERGLSLHAIAATLNGEGVPTPRGGSEWRASSVQSALGYRRPRPPAPGMPPGPPKASKSAGAPRHHERPKPRRHKGPKHSRGDQQP